MKKVLTNMPKGVTSLYFIHACSTFSYAILYSSLSLYITKQLCLSSAVSNAIVALFLTLNYVLQLLGGIIGGRLLSNRTLFFIAIIVQSLGLLFLAFAKISTLYMGLSMFLVGCGLSTTSYNNILTQRFKQDDYRRDTAFFMSYAAMNVGFCAGFILSGFFDFSNQYQTLFYASIVMNIITLILIKAYWVNFPDVDSPLLQIRKRTTTNLIGIFITLLFIPILLVCLNSSNLSNALVIIISLIMFLVILLLGIKQKTKIDRQRIIVYLILAVASILFWMIYYTGPMGVTLFIKHNVDKHFLGFETATQWIMNVNALTIIVGAPLISMVFNKLRAKEFNVSVSIQFVWAFVMLALSFFILASGIVFSNNEGYTNIAWVIGHFIVQAVAELLIGPVGYAMIGRIVPLPLQGVLMGSWMLVSGVAASLSHYFSNAMVKTNALDPLLTNADYYNVFKQLGTGALLSAIFLYFVSGKIKQFTNYDEINRDSTINNILA